MGKRWASLKTINVVAALVINQDQVVATQRGYGEFKDGWEFPGGKIEPGETPEEALKREIQEEPATEIRVGQPLTTVESAFCGEEDKRPARRSAFRTEESQQRCEH